MKDSGLVDFVAAIERHLTRLRGREHALPPPDFALAKAWFEAGVPLVNVLAGLDAAFDDSSSPSLAHRRARIEGAFGIERSQAPRD